MLNDIRKVLYARLVQKFGIYKTWESPTIPSQDKKERYDNFLKFFADVIVGNEWSSNDVQNQINWAITQQTKISGFDNIESFCQNKYIAKKHGFIDDDLLPKKIKCKY